MYLRCLVSLNLIFIYITITYLNYFSYYKYHQHARNNVILSLLRIPHYIYVYVYTIPIPPTFMVIIKTDIAHLVLLANTNMSEVFIGNVLKKRKIFEESKLSQNTQGTVCQNL